MISGDDGSALVRETSVLEEHGHAEALLGDADAPLLGSQRDPLHGAHAPWHAETERQGPREVPREPGVVLHECAVDPLEDFLIENARDVRQVDGFEPEREGENLVAISRAD